VTDRGDLDTRLARLAQATQAVRADDALVGAVLARVDPDAEGALGLWVWRTGRWALGAFAAAAILCVVWSQRALASADQGVLATVDPTELEP